MLSHTCHILFDPTRAALSHSNSSAALSKKPRCEADRLPAADLEVSSLETDNIRLACERYVHGAVSHMPTERPLITVSMDYEEGKDANQATRVFSVSLCQEAAQSLSAAHRKQLETLPTPRTIRVVDLDTTLPVLSLPCIDNTTDPSSSTSSTSSTSDMVLPEWKRKPLLLVGAGGIGCELLKVLVLQGFRHVVMVDLDTIDATNLNRQFLFQSCDVGKSKALTARESVLRWFQGRRERYPQGPEHLVTPPHLGAYQDNIKSERFDDAFFGQFAAVLNALDNVSARQHVNRMCMRSNVPLFESGTMGYNGQVQPIIKDVFECYDCNPKPADQKTFAVCTIHARPTTMVHCVHYAKELYETLFGERADMDSPTTADTIDATTTNAGSEDASKNNNNSGGELSYLLETVRRWRAEPEADSPAALAALGLHLAKTLFHDKITELLSMKSNWSTEPPVPLGDDLLQAAAASTNASSAVFSRDTLLSMSDCVGLFVSATASCARRVLRGEYISFKKEDDAIVDFVAAAANLRAHVFHIAEQSVEDLRTIAGAIVPAIATTNAIVAAGVVQQLEEHLRSVAEAGTSNSSSSPCRMIYVRKTPQTRRRLIHETSQFMAVSALGADADDSATTRKRRRTHGGTARTVTDKLLIHGVVPSAPRVDCPVCQSSTPQVHISIDMQCVSLHAFARDVLGERLQMEAPSVSCAARIIYEEEEYEDMGDTPLCEFVSGDGCGRTLSLMVDAINHDEEWQVNVRHAAGLDTNTATLTGVEAAKAAAAALNESKTAAAMAGETAKEAEETAPAGPVAGNTAESAIELDDDDASVNVAEDDEDVVVVD